jgi:hypothetical protein
VNVGESGLVDAKAAVEELGIYDLKLQNPETITQNGIYGEIQK